MRPFSYTRAGDVRTAVTAVAQDGGTKFLAGGTNLVDLMKIDVEAPRRIVDINALPLAGVARDGDRLVLGAVARMSDAADDATVRTLAPAVAESLAQAASGQLRNMATLGGNLLQRTRCGYFRDTGSACNKRVPGTGCSALEGDNARHAILGTSDRCIAVHPSDFAVALTAFDAIVRVEDADGARAVPIANFFLKPEQTPERETSLEAGELIVEIELPLSRALERSVYVKIRDRASYEFALASCAAGIDIGPDGTIDDVRIALGGVGTVPWRAPDAEAILRGKRPQRTEFAAAATAALHSAKPTAQNAYKYDLALSAIVRALETATAR